MSKLKVTVQLIFIVLMLGTVNMASAQEQIVIEEDGSISQSFEAITSDDQQTYTIVGDMTLSIVVLRDNIILDGNGHTLSGEAVIEIRECEKVIVKNVFISGTGGALGGISVFSSNDVQIVNNSFMISGDSIACYQSSNIQVSGNVFEEVGVGVKLWETNQSKVSDNEIGFGTYGIWFYDVEDSEISGNNLVGSGGGSGLRLHLGGGNTVFENVFTNSQLGVELISAGNLFYSNHFDVWKPAQVVVNPGSPDIPNTWDKDEEGNYWNDYSGTDSDNDGIGDSPYIIGAFNQDNYPVKESTVHEAETEITEIPTSIYIETPTGDEHIETSELFTFSGYMKPIIENAVIKMVSSNWPLSEELSVDRSGRFGISMSAALGGTYTITAIFEEDPPYRRSEAAVTIRVHEKSPCIIATAAYGSEMHPDVFQMRSLRDNKVRSSFTGDNFVNLFHVWYYSWSPPVAEAISGSDVLRGAMRLVLTPLVYAMRVSETVFNVFSAYLELASGVSILVAAALCGVFYLAPLFIAVYKMGIKIDSSGSIFVLSGAVSLFLALFGLMIKSVLVNTIGFGSLAILVSLSCGLEASRMLKDRNQC